MSICTPEHVEGIAFQPAAPNEDTPDRSWAGRCSVRCRRRPLFLAVCSCAPHPPPASFVYGRPGQVLREREVQIGKLDSMSATLRQEKEAVGGDVPGSRKPRLEEANRWSRGLDQKLAAGRARIVELQTELDRTAARFPDSDRHLEGETALRPNGQSSSTASWPAAGARVLKLRRNSGEVVGSCSDRHPGRGDRVRPNGEAAR